MSTEVEQRVVEMKFDNARFEQNASETISTLDKLKQRLNLSGATKGLEGVDAAAKNVNMSGLSAGVETVQAKFSAMSIVAVTALSNITNSAVNAGKRIVSALTIDPVKTGFSEYETQINAVQTILANTSSKGTTIDDVNKALDQLNTYADKTIYNFTEMTRNIGTFTAAGIDLDTSVNAIQGIANLAAVSGSTSQQASTAMYQLSQALSSGTVRLMDWNSVVNAGMGGEVFQNALKETARAHGVAIDSIIEKQGSFRESLSEGWLSAEILTDTLQKFTMTTEGLTEAEIEANREMLRSKGYTDEQIEEIFKLGETATDAATKVKTFSQLWDTLKEAAQSGWTQTWEIIVGDFEEAKELLTEVSNVIGGMLNNSANARNELLQGWKDAGGRATLIEALKNAFEGILGVVKPIKEAFSDIFPPLTVDQLIKFTNGLKDLTDKFKISEGTADKLKRTFKGVFAVVDIVRQAFMGVAKIFSPIISGTNEITGSVLDLTATIGDALVKFNEYIKSIDLFGNIGSGLSTIVKGIITGLSRVFSAINGSVVLPVLERIKDGFYGLGESIERTKQKFADAMKSMKNSADDSTIVQTLKKVWELTKKLGSGVFKAAGSLFEHIFEILGNADFEKIMQMLQTLSMAGVTSIIGTLAMKVSNLTGSFKDLIFGIGESISDAFDSVKNALEAGFEKKIFKIAIAIGLLAASLYLVSCIDSNKLAASLGAITFLFGEIIGVMAIFEKIPKGAKGANKSALAMIGLSLAVLIMAGALKKIGDLEPKQLAAGVAGVTALAGVVVGVAKILSSGGKTVIKGAVQMILFAAAVKILTSVCADLSELSWEGLAKGLVGVGAFMGGITFMLNTAKAGKKSISTALGMVLLAAAIKILASACGVFAQLSWEELAKGLAAVGVLLAEITLFTRLAGNAKKMISAGVAMIAVGAALKMFASVIQIFSGMSLEQIGKGLLTMAGALTAVTVALKLMPKNALILGVGLLAVASALTTMTDAIVKMSSLTWEEIGKGMTVLAGSLLILTVAMHAMKSALGGAAAMIITAGALAILAPALILLGSMSWGGIVKGLAAVAGVFLIMGVAAAILRPLVGVILGLSAAFALFGVGMVLVGAGLSAVSVGLMTFVTAIMSIVTAIVSLVPLIGAALMALCNVVIDCAPAIGEAIKAVVLTLIDVLVELVPVLADGILKLLVGLFEALVEYTPQLVDLIFDFLIGVLEGLTRNLPDLIQASVDVMMAFFSGVIDALGSIDTKTLVQGIAGVGIITALMAAIAAVGALVPAAMLGVIGLGLFIGELMLIFAAIGAFAQLPGLEWLISEGGNILGLLGKAIGQFFGGILGGIAQGMTSSLPAIGTHLSQFMENAKPFIEGVKLMDPSVMDGVQSLAGAILALTAANVLDGLTSWFTGGTSLAEFGQELAAFGPYMAEYAAAVKGINPETVEASANAAKALSEMAANLPNSGGVVGWFAGENNMDTFGTQLVSFGKSIKDYSLAVVGLNVEAINASVTAGTALSEMASSIPNLGGVVSWFCGDNDISTFGQNISSFGKSLKTYSTEVTGLNVTSISASVTAASKLSELQGSLDKTGGVISWFVGNNNIAKFGKNLVKFGASMKEYSAEITGISVSSISSATAEFKKLADLVRGIADVDFKGLSSFGKSLGTISKRGVDNFVSAFEDASDKVSEAGGELIGTFIEGMNEKTTDVKNAARDIASAAVDAIKDKLPSFSGAGNYVVEGFRDGISVNTFKAEAAARAMANAAAEAAKKALDEHSPSKVFYGIGDFAGVAFTNAIDDNVDGAYKSGYSMADHARKGLTAAISTVTDILNSDMDTQPTITPVLDLTDIESGIGVIGDLLGLGSTIGVSGNIHAVRSAMNNRNQNGETAELISSMDKLRKGLDGIGNTTYSINGISYDGGSDVAEAIQVLVRAAMRGGRA